MIEFQFPLKKEFVQRHLLEYDVTKTVYYDVQLLFAVKIFRNKSASLQTPYNILNISHITIDKDKDERWTKYKTSIIQNSNEHTGGWICSGWPGIKKLFYHRLM